MIYNLDEAVRVKTFGYISQRKGAWHTGQRSPNSTVVYCTEGSFTMNIEGEIFSVNASDALLIPPGKQFVPLDGGACRYYIMNFTASTLPDRELPEGQLTVTAHVDLEDGHAYSSRGDYSSFSKVKNLTKNASKKVKGIFERAEKLRPNESFSDQLLLDQLAKELIIRLGDLNAPRCSARLSDILKYIEQNYNSDLSLSSLAERFSLSDSYVARIFKNELDCKPSEYVNNFRVSVAEALLTTTDMSVSEIAETVGYSDVYYFSRIFKRIVGVPPSRVR